MIYKIYCNLYEKDQKDEFDQDWTAYGGKVNFVDKSRRALGHVGNEQYQLPQRERENMEPDPELYQRNYQNDRIRGDFIPSYRKMESMPVRRSNQYNQIGE